LEESYLNQYTESEEDASDAEDLEEKDRNLSEGQEIFNDELYCVACNKFFNSESSKKNHEASKKHKANMELLKSEMAAEEQNYQEKVQEEVKSSDNEDIEAASDVEEIEFESAKKSKGKKSKKKNKKIISYDEDSEPDKVETVQEVEESEDVPDIDGLKVTQSDDEEDWSNNKKTKKTKTKGKQKPVKSSELEVKAKVEEVPEKKLPVPIHEPSESDETENRCATCNELFPSKNKLFAHLKKTNHSIYLSQSNSKTGEKSSSKKKKK
jgi:DnaJ homolog subfamily A member 5